jgi:cation-transporting P-type ATPase 13A2
MRQVQRLYYGNCEVDVPKKSVSSLLVDEVLNPFYIFQVFSMVLWYWDGYEMYATCILFVSSASIIVSLYESISNNDSIRTMAKYSCDIKLYSQSQQSFRHIDSSELLPGDIIEIPQG